MPGSESQARKVRFGPYELDEAARELRKNGLSIHLQDQPWEVLRALLERPGEVVSREELRRRLWPDGTYVDYEQSLNKAVNKVREALCDSADKPRYVETVSRRGYRFVAAVESDGAAKPAAKTVEAEPKTVAPRRRALPWLAAGACVLAIVLVTGLWPIDVPQVEKVTALTNDATFKGRQLACDGSRIYFSDDAGIWWVAIAGGEPKRLALPFLRKGEWAGLAGYSSARRLLLIISERGLWFVGADGEDPHKVDTSGLGGFAFALAPGAERLAVLATDGIYIQSWAGARMKVHVALPRDTPLVWHPSGHILGFMRPSNDNLNSIRAWQVNDDGTNLRRSVPEREQAQWVGGWSQDGRRYAYTSEGEVFLRIQAGILGWQRRAAVTRLTPSGQFLGFAPVIDPLNPKRIYAVGISRRGETVRYDRQARRWVPFLGGFSGEMIDWSPDGQSMVYIPFPGAELHKCWIDGSGDIVLAPGVEALNPRWSPDGRRIAFLGRPSGKTGNRELWMVSSNGGEAAPNRPKIDSLTDAQWSHDGKRLLIGSDPAAELHGEQIRILDLETGKLEAVPGSEKFWAPRWSPDEKSILGVGDGWLPSIFDTVKRAWRRLGKQRIGYSEWSRDGKYIYGMDNGQRRTYAYQIDASSGRCELIAQSDFNTTDNLGYWVGWTRNGEPLTIRDLSSSQIYRLDLDH